jgi:5-methylcytosine-specific restriction endonuclease McrA
MDQSKRCPDCAEVKPASEWFRNKRNRGGLGSYCKSCQASRNRVSRAAHAEERSTHAREYRAATAEKITQRMRNYRSVNSEKIRLRNREYRKANAVQIKHSQQAYYQANAQKIALRQREYYAASEERRGVIRESVRELRKLFPERSRSYKNKYRTARMDNGHISYTAEQWRAKFDYWGQRCWICQIDLSHGGYHIDHVKPISKGGMDCLSNLRPACGSCNSRKSSTWPFAPPIQTSTEG